MPVYPEKLTSRQEARSAIASQFWGQQAQSARTLEGQAKTLPCEPIPVALSADTGLNRLQQLLAAQALLAPAIPSYSTADGGVVLDRVMLRKGGGAWWAALAARARAQKMVLDHRRGGELGKVLRDLNNYSLSARIRLGLGRNGAINVSAEVPNMHEFNQSLNEDGAAVTLLSGGEEPLCRGSTTLKYKIPGHELTAVATRNVEYLDSAAAYCTLPLAMSLDLHSLPRPDGIQYRAGVHRVTAPGQEASHGAIRSATAEAHPALESSLHLQGAVAVEGEATLWRARADRTAWPQGGRSAVHVFDGDVQDLGEWMSPDMRSTRGEDEADDSPTASLRTDPATDIAEPSQTSTSRIGDEHLRLQPLTWADQRAEDATSWRQPIDWQSELGLRGGAEELSLSPSKGPGSSAEGQYTAAQSHPRRPTFHFASAPIAGWGVSPLPAGNPWHPGLQKEKSQLEEWRERLGSGPILDGVQASRVQRGVVDARKSIDGVRASLAEATKQLRAAFQDEAGRKSARRGSNASLRLPYSPLLSEPHIKANGAIGCLARMPLPHDAFSMHTHQIPGANGSRGADSPADTPVPGRWSQELWTPYLKDTALRVFASCGISAQAGRFRKRFADYTAASIRLDCGLSSPESPTTVVGAGGVNGASEKPGVAAQRDLPTGSRLSRHRAFALEGRGIWHAGSISVGQQIWGPLRARFDTRLALDTKAQGADDTTSRRSLSSVIMGTAWLQPVKLESVWGLDMVIPGTQGSARACAWFSPTRGEGMLELRLF